MVTNVRSRSGFTLIEMLVVMAVIALLLTLASPRYFGSLDRARDQTLAHNLAVLRDSLDKFYADRGSYPEALGDLVEKRYLRAIPVDPVTGSESTWITVPSRDPEVRGIVDIRSGAQGHAQDGRGYDSM